MSIIKIHCKLHLLQTKHMMESSDINLKFKKGYIDLQIDYIDFYPPNPVGEEQ